MKTVLKIEFAGAAADSGLYMAAIADPQLNVGSDGNEKTQFAPGEVFYFLVGFDPSLYLAGIQSSSGSVQRLLGTATRSHTQEISVTTAESTVQLSYWPATDPVFRWYGNAPQLARSSRDLSYRSGPLPAIAEASYQAGWQSYRLIPPVVSLTDDEEWPVLIIATLEHR